MTCGIYLLGFNNTHKVYIGQSLCIENRFYHHNYLLSNNKHSVKLTEAYNTFGPPSSLEVQTECSIDRLNIEEQKYIDFWNSVEDGFNCVSDVSKGPKIYGERNGKSKYPNSKIIEVFLLLIEGTYSVKHISSLTQVSEGTVRSILQGVNHRWLEQVFPSDYKALLDIPKYYKLSDSIRGREVPYPILYGPDNNQYIVRSTRKFAKEHCLNQGNLHSVLSGVRVQHKGYSLVPNH